jgi:glycosyltransferase involved in cell wall biosynthesis
MKGIARARLTVVPSLWAEPFGRTVIESLALGTPVLVSRTGGLAELAGDGVTTFPAGEPQALAALIETRSVDNEETARRERASARHQYERQFSSAVWLSATEKVLARAKVLYS